MLPGDKAAKVAALQKSGKRVAMVGDGINDSPALAQADVGFAVASGTDMALAAASVMLLKHDLRDVLGTILVRSVSRRYSLVSFCLLVVAIDLSRTAFLRIKYNLGWAFVYNVAAITLGVVLVRARLHPSGVGRLIRTVFVHPGGHRFDPLTAVSHSGHH